MLFSKKFLLILATLTFIGALYLVSLLNLHSKIKQKILGSKIPPQDTRQPTQTSVNNKIKVKYPQDFTIVLVGDSMTERLGNSDELRADFKKYYPDKSVEVLNYGFGATNILSVPERLEKETFHNRAFRPILDIDFDLIIIESFGHNPLSQFSLEEGLKKQTETLDQITKLIQNSNPRAKIAFLATISPNRKKYALNNVDLTTENREKWAEERIAYIKNHISFAQAHNIPLINVYEKSLNKEGDGNLEYISKADYIHPSPTGVYLISEEIAKAIFNSQLF